MDQESSFELIRRAQDGDRSALDRLLERYRPRLVRWARGRLPRHAREGTDTEDLVQDVLIRTFKNLDDFGTQGEWALQAYLRTAVTNRVRDELRRVGGRPNRQEIPETVATADASPLEVAIGHEKFERYERALASLDPVEREAVVARLEIGSSYADISALLGKPSADAARMTVTRALVKLADLMSR
jgi:RNA polymerase sigma-70 factor (ECF subfamily)